MFGPGRLVFLEPLDQLAIEKSEIERPVLADDRIYRPHARDVVAPARRPAGDRHYEPARPLQALHCGVGAGRRLALRSKCLVDVEQQTADALRVTHLRERLHARPSAVATRSRWARLISRPALVRRHNTSSAVWAHSWSTTYRTSRSLRPAP